MLRQVSLYKYKMSDVKNRCVFQCFFNVITLGERLMLSGRVFHSAAAAVSINHKFYSPISVWYQRSCICRFQMPSRVAPHPFF